MQSRTYHLVTVFDDFGDADWQEVYEEEADAIRRIQRLHTSGYENVKVSQHTPTQRPLSLILEDAWRFA